VAGRGGREESVTCPYVHEGGPEWLHICTGPAAKLSIPGCLVFCRHLIPRLRYVGRIVFQSDVSLRRIREGFVGIRTRNIALACGHRQFPLLSLSLSLSLYIYLRSFFFSYLSCLVSPPLTLLPSHATTKLFLVWPVALYRRYRDTLF